jgi:alpha-tubulin suppressor-like RCC1 family protein
VSSVPSSRLRRRIVLLVPVASISAFSAIAGCSDDESNSPATPSADASADGAKADSTTGADATSGADASDNDGSVNDASVDAPEDALSDASLVTCSVTPCAIQLAAGSDNACVILSDKTVRCWGSNFMGESAQPLPTDGGYGAPLLVGTPITGLTTVRELTIGAEHSCALTETGVVQCWGSNQYGQLAQPTDGGKQNRTPTPTTIAVTGTVANVSSGFYTTCVRRNDGTAQCWGDNNWMQIGNVSSDGGSLGKTVLPTDALLTDIVELDVGGRFACGFLTDAGVSCWGHNVQGQLGRGGPPFNPTVDPRPAPVMALEDASVQHLARSVGYNEGVVLSDKTIRLWGSGTYGVIGPVGDASTGTGTPVPFPGLTDVTQLAFGYAAGCALKSDGTVWCWGTTLSGADGLEPDGGDAGIGTPKLVQIQGVSDAVQIAVGWDVFGCALIKNGSVMCWGDNAFGQLGRGLTKAQLPYDPHAAPATL